MITWDGEKDVRGRDKGRKSIPGGQIRRAVCSSKGRGKKGDTDKGARKEEGRRKKAC